MIYAYSSVKRGVYGEGEANYGYLRGGNGGIEAGGVQHGSQFRFGGVTAI